MRHIMRAGQSRIFAAGPGQTGSRWTARRPFRWPRFTH